MINTTHTTKFEDDHTTRDQVDQVVVSLCPMAKIEKTNAKQNRLFRVKKMTKISKSGRACFVTRGKEIEVIAISFVSSLISVFLIN